ncbi:MAG TPA: branched-chain amino acid ABC transporter permease [Rhodopila sp.]|nr:branched-chain amino acid ABC transporter permease [Rhodopila sp.]
MLKPAKSRAGGRIALRALPVVEWLVFAALVAAPFLLSERLDLITLITNMMILSIFAISFDMCWGFSGIMSFGQALFFGVSGYVIALVGRDLNFSAIWGVLPLAMATGLLLAAILAAFLLLGRKVPSVIFVAFGTLTGSYAAERLVSGWQYVGAGNGLSSIKLLQLGSFEFVEGFEFYALAFLCLLAVYLVCRFIVRSQLGLVLAGIRQNEERLAFLGYRVQFFKAVIFSFAGMAAGLAGALYSYHQGFIGPANMGPGLSTTAVIYCLLGGAGTLIGPVIGTVAIEGLSYGLSDIAAIRHFWPVILGLVLLVVVMFQPTGLLGLVVSQRERIGSYGVRGRRGTRGGARV